MPDSHNDNATLLIPPQTQITFFNLSRELRDLCYFFCLVTPIPIFAWSGIRSENQDSRNAHDIFDWDLKQVEEDKLKMADLRRHAQNLFQCHSTISDEAAVVFYSKNTFRFEGDWTWDIAVNWLETIGPKNRGSVSLLEFRTYELLHAWQNPDGERVEVHDTLEPPFARNPHLFRARESRSEGYVENINPAIETFFKLVSHGSNRNSPPLSLNMRLRDKLFPGFQMFFVENIPYDGYFGMDLADTIERLRTIYTNNSRRIEVVWQGRVPKYHFLEKENNIKTQ